MIFRIEHPMAAITFIENYSPFEVRLSSSLSSYYFSYLTVLEYVGCVCMLVGIARLYLLYDLKYNLSKYQNVLDKSSVTRSD